MRKHFHDSDSEIPEKGTQAYEELVIECKQNEAKCIKERAEFDGSCIQQWVCWLDHIYKYLKSNLVSIRVDATITLKQTM